MRSCIFSIITAVFSVTWSSEISLICWFTAHETFIIIMNVENSCAASYFCGNCDIFSHRKLLTVPKLLNSIEWMLIFLTLSVIKAPEGRASAVTHRGQRSESSAVIKHLFSYRQHTSSSSLITVRLFQLCTGLCDALARCQKTSGNSTNSRRNKCQACICVYALKKSSK